MMRHLSLAHHYWSFLLAQGDTAIDATCGNGQDTLQLAKLLNQKGGGHVIGLDIQETAIEKTSVLLKEHGLQATLLRQSHELFPTADPVKLIVYNLGYLPGGNKSLTTQTETTLKSLDNALRLIQNGGAISLTAYPGHEEGLREFHAVREFLQDLPASEWSICEHQWINRPLAPVLFFLQKH